MNIADIARDEADRVENIQAVKGEKFANIVRFCLNNFKQHSVVAEALTCLAPEKAGAKQLIVAIMTQKVMVSESESNLMLFLDALGMGENDQAEIEEAIDMADNIHKSCLAKAKALAN